MNKYKLNYEELLIRFYFLPFSMYLLQPTFLFEFTGAEVLHVPPFKIHVRQIKEKIYSFSLKKSQKRKNPTSVLPPNEVNCHYYWKWSVLLESSWSKSPNYKAFEKLSKKTSQSKTFVLGSWRVIASCAEIPGQDSNPVQDSKPTTGGTPLRTSWKSTITSTTTKTTTTTGLHTVLRGHTWKRSLYY